MLTSLVKGVDDFVLVLTLNRDKLSLMYVVSFNTKYN